jgi:hypothetical protein
VLQDRLCVELVRHEAHHRFDPDVPGDVAAQFALRDAEIAEGLGNAASGMVADQQKRGGALRPQRQDRGGSLAPAGVQA